ncbi:MAG: tetratricopeptide repeat protein [Bacteroidia bacterium]|jgi:tetratricopeptide (TPR) repeat protein
MKYIFLSRVTIFFILLYPVFCLSQTKKIDSLLVEIEKNKNDTSEVNSLNSLAWELRKIDYSKALDYLEKALDISKKNNFLKGEGNTYSRQADIFYFVGSYHKAEELYSKALLVKEKLNDKRGVAKCLQNIGDVKVNLGNYQNAANKYLESIKEYEVVGEIKSMPLNNIAVCYFYLGEYEKSLEYYFKALQYFENQGNKEKMINPALGVGNVYNAMKKYSKALEYYKKALKISEEINSKPRISLSLNNIGNVYQHLHNTDTALIYYINSLKINEEINDKQAIALSLMNIGNTYSTNKNFEKALEYYRRALRHNEETNNKNESAKALINIGIVYSKNGELKKAIEYLQIGLNKATSINSKELIIKGNEELSELYFRSGDYKRAYDYYKTYTSVKDSILNETSSKYIAELNTKYETEKKEKEIESLQKNAQLRDAQLESQRNQRNGFIVGIALLILLIILAYNRYRIKQKASKEIAEKNKEITESISYAKRIQTSFLTSEKYISQRLQDYFIYYNPRNIVSGDFYWLMDKNNNMYICTADCTGHGIPGAFMSLISMGILNEIIYSKTHITHTDEILNELRRIIIMAVNPEGSSEEGKDGMDAVLCRFDFNNMQLEYSAANNSFFIIRNGELMVFKPDKMPVGKYLGEEKPFTRNTVPIQKGDCIYTFSDGYADQFGGPNNKKFQSKRLKELFLNNCHKPMSVQKEIYEKTLKEWQGGNEQVDDILLMGIRV